MNKIKYFLYLIKNKAFYVDKASYILIISIFLVFFYNITSINLRLQANSDNTFLANFLSISAEMLLTFCIALTFFFIFSFNKYVLKLWAICFILISGSLSYYVLFNKIFIEEVFIASIFETKISDAGQAFNIVSILWFFVFAIFPAIFFSYFVRIKKNTLPLFPSRLIYFFKRTGFLAIIGISCFILSFVFNSKMYTQSGYVLKGSLAPYQPSNYVAGLWQYFDRIKGVDNIDLVKIEELYPFKFTDPKFKDESLTVILVIGESARADRQSMNGYAYETNPLLSKKSNLVNFSDGYSCDTFTISSVHCMLNYKSRKDFKLEIKETHLISAFKSLGFDTYFISNQTMYNSLPFMLFMKEGSDAFIFGNQVRANIPSGSEEYDEYMLPFIKDFNEKSTNSKKLFVIQLIGSHTPYGIRYPERFKKFDNDYDNTVLYTDYIMSEIIDYFANDNTFLIYASDHGESLGENGVILHGAQRSIAPKEQINIQFFVWVSESMRKIFANKYEVIESKKDNQVSHDNIYHTMFDCLGIDSKVVDKKLSLCN